jgi:hypothetical protein
MAKLYAVPVTWEEKDGTPRTGCVIAMARNSEDAREQIMSRFPQFYKGLKITSAPHLATEKTYLVSYPPGMSATPGYEGLNWSK